MQMGFLIAFSIAGFLLLGLYADKYLHTHPLFLLAGVILGLVVTVYDVYHLLHPLIHGDDHD